jgi:hypothetical protein
MPTKKKQRTRKRSVAREITPKRKVTGKRASSKQSSITRKRKRRVTSTSLVGETVDTVPFPPEERRDRRNGQSGDLQGISNRPSANSESVEELLKEGNALEAEAIQGVEDALDADEAEVETHEVPEDDVPQEYLDKDR